MLDITPEKLLMVTVIGFLVLGPERVPQVARMLGKARSQIRQLTSLVPSEALQTIQQPRQAVMDAIAEPRRVVNDIVAEPRSAAATALANLQFGPSPASVGDESHPLTATDVRPELN